MAVFKMLKMHEEVHFVKTMKNSMETNVVFVIAEE
jgi:hypothetical protein